MPYSVAEGGGGGGEKKKKKVGKPIGDPVRGRDAPITGISCTREHVNKTTP